MGQRRPQGSLCCCHISAADAATVPAADASLQRVAEHALQGQCGVLESLQHMTFTSCCVMRT